MEHHAFVDLITKDICLCISVNSHSTFPEVGERVYGAHFTSEKIEAHILLMTCLS